MKKEYRVLIEQISWLQTIVEADSLEEAIELAKDSSDWEDYDGTEDTGKYEVFNNEGDCITQGDDFEMGEDNN
jgi:hypothetical protein